MKARELRELTNEELYQKYNDFKTELFNLRFRSAVEQLKDTSKIRQIKRDIARIKTIINERKRQQN